MMREINEEVRRRMLADESVQSMIRMRAYEIYQQRGGAPGREAEDWLQAESEVLSYLTSQRATEKKAAASKTSSRARSTATGKKKEATATEKKPARRTTKKSVEPETKSKKTQRTRKKKEA